MGFVVMDSAAVPDASGGDADDDDDDDDEDDNEIGVTKAEGLSATLRHKFDKIAGSIPPNTWLLTHAPFNGVHPSESDYPQALRLYVVESRRSPRDQVGRSAVQRRRRSYCPLSFGGEVLALQRGGLRARQ